MATIWQYPVRVGAITICGLERTRRAVVQQELLFARGDTVDSAAVEESARNLRRLLFLADATIRLTRLVGAAGDSAGRGAPAAVRAEVRVRELYSRALSPLAAGDLDEPSYGATALDYNLFGAGQIGRLTAYRDAVSGNSASLLYRVPRAAGSRLGVETHLGWAEEGHRFQVGVDQLFHTLASRWSFAVEAADVEETHRLYGAGGQLAARYRERRLAAGLRATGSFGSHTKVRPGVGLDIRDQQFDPELGLAYAPDDRRRVVPSVRLVLWRPRYARARFVHALGRLEDLQTGSWLALRLGASHRALGSDRTYPFASLVLAPRLQPRLGSATYAFLHLSVSSRYAGGGHENLVVVAQALVYGQRRHRHTAAVRLRAEALSNPEDEAQFLLGVSAGLRGHRPRSQNGTRRLIANLELRPLLWRHAQLTVAGAGFVDAGTAWTPGQTRADLRAGAGLGVRVGLPQVYATPVLRLDLARGIPDGVTQIAFGTGHYF